ncbi:MAG: peroxiredoxin [Candidatus Nanopelagicales bacterium]|nr:peroxiredoxin [Candidatus Nanopelagicales bacterium]
MSVAVGQPAPSFTLSNQYGESVSLEDYRGKKNVVLMFYPFAFTGICTGELCTIRDRYADFVNEDTVVLSVSCDSMHTLKVFAAQENLTHAMLSDFWPHGEVSKAYGAFLDDKGFATRASFVIDKDGIVRWAVVNGPGEARSADDYAAALAAL